MLVSRKALIVGIDSYNAASLQGCVRDAKLIKSILSKHENRRPNFQCFQAADENGVVTRAILKRKITDLFEGTADVALLYFAGHGIANNLGGFLVTQDAVRHDEGVSMQDILSLANKAEGIKEIIVLLDCCNSGYFGTTLTLPNDFALLRDGVAVLTASRADQPAIETGSGGIFTKLLISALSGGASDILGKITIASVYSYVDQVMGVWGQRPLFKANISTLISLRDCKPCVPLQELRMLRRDFPTPEFDFKLDPSYEPNKSDPEFAAVVGPRNSKHENIFKRLQKFRAARLLVPVGEDHMYYAAMRKKSCKLTSLGQLYWQLATDEKF